MHTYAHAQWVETDKTAVSVISESKIFGTCFARCLQSIAPEFEVLSYHGIQEWLNGEAPSNGIVLLCAMGRKATEAFISLTPECASGARVIIVSDIEDPTVKMLALARGAKGYFTMDADLEAALEAIRLVNAGGSFVPSGGTSDIKLACPPQAEATVALSAHFTERQLDVLKLTRQGDPNKIIAYKLNLSQATVKVHLRNMMRKLKAKNRIELILKSDQIRGLNWVPEDESATDIQG